MAFYYKGNQIYVHNTTSDEIKGPFSFKQIFGEKTVLINNNFFILLYIVDATEIDSLDGGFHGKSSTEKFNQYFTNEKILFAFKVIIIWFCEQYL